MRFLDEQDVRSVFDLDTAIASQRTAFIALARGEAWQPGKILGGHADDPSTVFCYASRLDRLSGPVCKFGSLNPGNAGTDRPTIHAVVAVLDRHTGAPLAFMDGTALTTLRTAAASAVAVEALARKGAARLLVLGSGVQGRAHIAALQHGGDYAWTGMWSPRRPSLDASVDRLREQGCEVEPVESLSDAISGADVIVCATLATEPLFSAREISPGATIITVGSFERHRCEIGPDILYAGHRVVVDHEPTARQNCGPIVAARARAEAPELELLELGHVLTGDETGRGSDDDIVTYLSAGLGVQDAAAAWAIHQRAEARGVGRSVDRPTASQPEFTSPELTPPDPVPPNPAVSHGHPQGVTDHDY
ncbi:ornithine cyclodeaminase family protein [Streptomyces fulvoviolaceus]|uniref:ornithine cyclodeaminase family protein n=1 Tax=Streptomyces fulvoviolaceus TaxID=285535 RepID=UPI0021C15219|nr:ornithine cyclodeaminase family protein [Streptomyces fulvoviolaceus]MCT9080087.1 ornithine cyclodeaminase family protein [Streptomyces fulvoviolaceus]